MIFGNKETLALDCELDTFPNSFYECNFCYWANGKIVGNYQRGTALGPAYYFYERNLNGPSRYNVELAAKSDTEILDTIFGAIYDLSTAAEATLEQLQQELKEYKRYDVSEQIPAFDGYLIVVVDGAQQQRFVWRQWTDNGKVDKGITLPLGTYESVIKQFLEWGKLILLRPEDPYIKERAE